MPSSPFVWVVGGSGGRRRQRYGGKRQENEASGQTREGGEGGDCSGVAPAGQQIGATLWRQFALVAEKEAGARAHVPPPPDSKSSLWTRRSLVAHMGVEEKGGWSTHSQQRRPGVEARYVDHRHAVAGHLSSRPAHEQNNERHHRGGRPQPQRLPRPGHGTGTPAGRRPPGRHRPTVGATLTRCGCRASRRPYRRAPLAGTGHLRGVRGLPRGRSPTLLRIHARRAQ